MRGLVVVSAAHRGVVLSTGGLHRGGAVVTGNARIVPHCSSGRVVVNLAVEVVVDSAFERRSAFVRLGVLGRVVREALSKGVIG